MIKRNANFAKLNNGYLFPEIHKRKLKFISDHPQAEVISLGIGDTTEPIPSSIAHAMSQEAMKLGTIQGYSGYGPEQGLNELRERIASQLYFNRISSSEVFVSDGAKCDIGRLQMLLGKHVSVAIQDPAYPVYVDGSIIQGVSNIVYMPCTPENNFFPDLERTPRTDIIYFCSPNNPTGAVATKDQLTRLVDFAKSNQTIILFDSAYASFIQDPSLPKSIFEIPGAKEVAIEVSSFSKLAGFTGVRLGWTIIPQALKYEDGTPVNADWQRLTTTIFNGASNIAQQGGMAVLEDRGLQEVKKTCQLYLENAQLIKVALEQQGWEVYGGTNAPYLWVRFKNRKSWEVFQALLENYHIITTPGSGFGPSGEGFIRFTAFGTRNNIMLAINRLKKPFVC
ncbi:Aminotransferase ALD1 [Neochlamydia sp. TUME1]|uniref:LL-diaminopimelate aminotransferase n=1 Tax=Neochlamydia sp. TUME1 TaxID=1478174 RepID=UPI00057EAF29|nr:LL-diaminopimelate aminotransferase [Neochlamydia sp. TUME1]KIC75006.1 Aminotransferase ALD1 [Neochlamydia sp. TUME1]